MTFSNEIEQSTFPSNFNTYIYLFERRLQYITQRTWAEWKKRQRFEHVKPAKLIPNAN